MLLQQAVYADLHHFTYRYHVTVMLMSQTVQVSRSRATPSFMPALPVVSLVMNDVTPPAACCNK